MKKILFSTLLLCTFLSCSKTAFDTKKDSTLSFTAGFDESTKSMLNDDRSQSWLGGDVVNVYDVTDQTAVQDADNYAQFTNTSSTQSSSATFVINSGFDEFSFTAGHKYLVLHNATIQDYQADRYRINFDQNFYSCNYTPSRKYGIPDNTIPVACRFTYEDESSLNNLSFHNMVALYVVKVANNTGSPINIGKVVLEASCAGHTSLWGHRIFGPTSFYYYDQTTYNANSWSINQKTSATVNCGSEGDEIPNDDEHYYGFVLNTPPCWPGTISIIAKVYDIENSELESSESKLIYDNTATPKKTWYAGHTYRIDLTVSPD